MNQKYIFFILVIHVIMTCQAIVTLIDAPGVYPLGGGIIADPIVDNDTIVTIAASNVVLDIKEYVLTQLSTNTLNGLMGIFIAPNLNNITIRNGTIEDTSGVGIYVSDGCSEIYLENLSIINCNQTGIFLDGNPTGSGIINVTISDCLITSCSGVTNTPLCGLKMVATKNCIVSNSAFNNNYSYSADAGYGIYIELCSNCEFENCKTYGNGGSLLGVGISLFNAANCSFLNCNASDNKALSLVTTVTSYGFLADYCFALLFSGCKALDNSHVIGNSIGFKTVHSTNNLFEKCIAANNIGGILAAGFFFDETNSNFGISNNIAASNIADLTKGESYGILLDGAQGFFVNNNTFASNRGNQGFGLADTIIDTNNLISSNLSYNNTTTGYSVSMTQGEFPVIFVTNNNFSSLNQSSSYYNVAVV